MNKNTYNKIIAGKGHTIRQMRFEGWTYSQIATKMGMKLANVVQHDRNWTSENERLYQLHLDGYDISTYNTKPDTTSEASVSPSNISSVSEATDNLLVAVGALLEAVEATGAHIKPRTLIKMRELIETL